MKNESYAVLYYISLRECSKNAIDYVLNGKFAMLQEHEIYSKAETLDRKGSRARNGFNL